MKVSDLGEFGLIDRLADVLAAGGSAVLSGRLAVGIGDDAAVWRGEGEAVVATTDTLVEGVHFLPEHLPWRDLGWKALAVNVSDIAAMGGTPGFALVTLALRGSEEAENLDALYAGIAEAAGAWEVAVAGGDIVRANEVMISIALIGHAELDGSGEPLVLRRNAASAGDVIAVTGALGGAAAGLQALRDGAQDSENARALIERHLRPEARVDAGLAAIAAGLRCAIDVSDGLLQDIGHICKASRVGAVVWRDKVPIDPALRDYEPGAALRYAVAGGEDYELVLVGASEQIDAIARAVDVPLTVIGEMVIDSDAQAKLLDESAKEIDVPAGGWDHLREG
ncbi:MAG: thiamine-phosphate kinase [Dehalococcoidia bacterium]